MKIKVIGFKVGQSRPTANRTITALIGEGLMQIHESESIPKLGKAVYEVLQKSDFISIRRVDN